MSTSLIFLTKSVAAIFSVSVVMTIPKVFKLLTKLIVVVLKVLGFFFFSFAVKFPYV